MDQLYMLRAFVAAARHRSFSKAGESLGVTTGSISKAIAKLEASVQTRLLHRTTRSVSVTEAAKEYYLTCCRLLEELDEANRRITQEREADRGVLRLAVHPMLVNSTLSRLLGDYRSIAPNVNLIVSAQEHTVSLLDGEFDMAILPPHLVEQSAVIRRTLWTSPYILVASRQYLEQYGTPASASELSHHFLLLDTELGRQESGFVDLTEAGKGVSVLPRSSMEGNEGMLRAAALTGAGIAILPEAVVREDLAAGDLEQVLPRCSTAGGGAEFCLFYSHRELLPARLRTFVDFCTEFFQSLSTSELAGTRTSTGPKDSLDSPVVTVV
jgi:DNA-binding transcriptional LysR family regulator